MSSTESRSDLNISTEQPAASPSVSTSSRTNSMAQALSGDLARPGSGKRSSSGSPRPEQRRSLSNSGQISLEAALGAGKGVGRIVGAGLKSPMDFTLSLARGFHNAPKLYGDKSVRPQEKITGIQSGLRAAGKVSTPSPAANKSCNNSAGIWVWLLRRHFGPCNPAS